MGRGSLDEHITRLILYLDPLFPIKLLSSRDQKQLIMGKSTQVKILVNFDDDEYYYDRELEHVCGSKLMLSNQLNDTYVSFCCC